MQRRTVSWVILTVAVSVPWARSDDVRTTRPSHTLTTRPLIDATSLLNVARTATEAGVRDGELSIISSLRGGAMFAKARTAFSQAVLIAREPGFQAENPQVATTILGEAAWFTYKADGNVEAASKALSEAAQIEPRDPVVRYKAAAIAADAYFHGHEKTQLAIALEAIDGAIKEEPEMPEAYRLRAVLNSDPKRREQQTSDYRAYLRFAERIRPEFCLYDFRLIEARKAAVEKYLATVTDARPAGSK